MAWLYVLMGGYKNDSRCVCGMAWQLCIDGVFGIWHGMVCDICEMAWQFFGNGFCVVHMCTW